MSLSPHVSRPISNRWRPLFIAAAIPILAGRGITTTYATDGAKNVVGTTGQVSDLLRNLGGDLLNVHGLMGPGVDPHLFKASEQDVIALIDADAIFYSGLHLEGTLGEVLEQLGKRSPVAAAGEGVPTEELIRPEDDAFDGNPDPHFWFDPALWSYAADHFAHALAELDESHAETYLENAEAYRVQLAELDEYARQQFAKVPERSRILVTAHDAFGYLGRRYNLRVVGLQGISTATEAGVRDVQSIADLLVENQVQAIFVETSVPERTIEAVQVAAADRGWNVEIGGSLYSDAMGEDDTEEGTYVGMMRYDVDTIVTGLSGETSS
jgi:manganese/zinc/iron transport system substrate-binding protein